jgi:hypothetical protein
MAKIYQIIGRAVRNCTHQKFNEQERTVTPILYLSKYKHNLKDLTHDMKKYNECVNDSDAYVPYLNLLKQTAVDCQLNEQIVYQGKPVHKILNKKCTVDVGINVNYRADSVPHKKVASKTVRKFKSA